MKKLSLDMDALRVESFPTADDQSQRGTVRGHVETDCCTYSCNGTCGAWLDSGNDRYTPSYKQNCCV